MVLGSFRFVTYIDIYLRFEMEVKRKNSGKAQLACFSADPPVSCIMFCQVQLGSITLKAQGKIALIPVISQKSTNAGYSSSP
jgi:hypothetical protein